MYVGQSAGQPVDRSLGLVASHTAKLSYTNLKTASQSATVKQPATGGYLLRHDDALAVCTAVFVRSRPRQRVIITTLTTLAAVFIPLGLKTNSISDRYTTVSLPVPSGAKLHLSHLSLT